MVAWLMLCLALTQAIEFGYQLKPLGAQCFT